MEEGVNGAKRAFPGWISRFTGYNGCGSRRDRHVSVGVLPPRRRGIKSMARPVAGCLLLVALIAFGHLAPPAASQDVSPSKKTDEPKKASKKDQKADDDLSNLPPGSKVWMSSERVKELEDRYQKLLEQFASLERQFKSEKQLPSACKLTGRIDGDVATLKAEFLFSTDLPGSTIYLGLKNSFLVDEGQIDDGVPHLDATDDGYFVRVQKDGPHRVTLNVRVPLVNRRSGNAGPNNERGFDLGLPGSAVTTLSLDLSKAAKDLRINDAVVAPRQPGRWETTLGSQKSLAVTWKEVATTPSAAIAPSAKANVKVKLVEGRVELIGDLVLEDAKSVVRDWHLLLPPQVKVSPAVGSADFTWIPPEGKSNVHLIRVTEPGDRVTISLQAQYSRTQSQQKLPIGPFLIQEAPTQGTLLIQAAPGVLRGQRLLYHRYGEVFQRDPPKGVPGLDNIAQFQFWNATFGGKALSPSRSPLELEWKNEKGQVDAAVEHEIRVRDDQGQWLIDVESKFVVQSANSGLDTLEMQMPAAVLPGMFWLGVQPSLGFPAALRWPVALTPRPAFPLNVQVADESPIDLSAPDSQQRVRLKLSRPIGNEIAVKVQSRYLAPSDADRFLVDLPRLVGTLDRGAKVTVWSPPGQEFLVGPAEQPEPIHDKFQQIFEQMPASLELAWRGSQRERTAKSIADLIVRDTAIQVKQTLLLPAAMWSGGATQTGQVALRTPSPGFAFSVGGGARLSQDKSLAWIKLPPENKGYYEIDLAYDISRNPKQRDVATAIPLLWPENVTNREVKVRIWTDPGVTPKLQGMADFWKERPLEEGSVTGAWPSLVAVGLGGAVPIAMTFEQSAGHRLPTMVADRSLIQVRLEDDGSQTYRCRYLVRKFSASTIEIELPVSWELGQPHFAVAGKEVGGVVVTDPLRNRVRVPLAPNLPQPTLFEITYQVPAPAVEGRRFWQTPLSPPRFVGDTIFGLTRWQLSLPDLQIPIVLGPNPMDFHWTLKGWLLAPEPSVTASDLDTWIGGDSAGDAETVSLSWWRNTADSQRVYHFPRQIWLIVWSGLTLLLGLFAVTAAPRFMLALFGLVVCVGIVALGLFHENLLPAIFVGAQPGLAVLLLIVAGHWIIQERTRRNAQHVPAFSRVPLGSTLIRTAPKPHSPSTIDAPAAGPGSVKNATT